MIAKRRNGDSVQLSCTLNCTALRHMTDFAIDCDFDGVWSDDLIGENRCTLLSFVNACHV